MVGCWCHSRFSKIPLTLFSIFFGEREAGQNHRNSSKKSYHKKLFESSSFGAFRREAPEPLLPLKVRGLVHLPDFPDLPPGPLPGRWHTRWPGIKRNVCRLGCCYIPVMSELRAGITVMVIEMILAGIAK